MLEPLTARLPGIAAHFANRISLFYDWMLIQGFLTLETGFCLKFYKHLILKTLCTNCQTEATWK